MQPTKQHIILGVVVVTLIVGGIIVLSTSNAKEVQKARDPVSKSFERQCFQSGANSPCSNRGRCFIGKCFCESGRDGKFCEEKKNLPLLKTSCSDNVINFDSYKDPQNLFQFHRYDYCKYYSEAGGVMNVDEKRWKTAQALEKGVWSNNDVSDDRNSQHRKWFDGYKSIIKFLNQGNNLGDVIEIGSGPFSQTNTILETVGSTSVNTITLVDPLLTDYVQSTGKNTYKSGSLRNLPTILVKAGAEQVSKFKTDYDTVIMINVLEHCVDGWKVLENLYDLLKPGGLFIFSERWYDKKWDQYNGNNPFWDALHPINTKKLVIDQLLKQYKPLFRRDFYYEGDYPTDEGTYFIGVKK
jgi:2-polyprenyl-3-methyl-5-hydroxy-6-metoxy-1,4-benzoquinol methylase